MNWVCFNLFVFTIIVFLHEHDFKYFRSRIRAPWYNQMQKSEDELIQFKNISSVMPSMARKAGGSWRKPDIHLQPRSTNISLDGGVTGGTTPKYPEKVHNSDESRRDSSSSEENDEAEKNCPRDHFYHLRGKQCVPWNCYGGNVWRNKETGECTEKEVVDSGYAVRGWKRNYWKRVSTETTPKPRNTWKQIYIDDEQQSTESFNSSD